MLPTAAASDAQIAAVRLAAEHLNAVVDAAHPHGLHVDLRVLDLRDAKRADPPAMVYPVVTWRI